MVFTRRQRPETELEIPETQAQPPQPNSHRSRSEEVVPPQSHIAGSAAVMPQSLRNGDGGGHDNGSRPPGSHFEGDRQPPQSHRGPGGSHEPSHRSSGGSREGEDRPTGSQRGLASQCGSGAGRDGGDRNSDHGREGEGRQPGSQAPRSVDGRDDVHNPPPGNNPPPNNEGNNPPPINGGNGAGAIPPPPLPPPSIAFTSSDVSFAGPGQRGRQLMALAEPIDRFTYLTALETINETFARQLRARGVEIPRREFSLSLLTSSFSP